MRLTTFDVAVRSRMSGAGTGGHDINGDPSVTRAAAAIERGPWDVGYRVRLQRYWPEQL